MKKRIDMTDLNSIMEGFDISTQPATNAGAPFTGGNPPANVQGLYNEISNPASDEGGFELDIPVEVAEGVIELTKTQEENLNNILKDFNSSEEEENFSKMVTSLLKI